MVMKIFSQLFAAICTLAYPQNDIANKILPKAGILFVFCFVHICVAAPDIYNKQKIIASYLYNFAKNIEWPNESGLTTFNMAVYGADDPLLMTELNSLSEKMKLRNLAITVTQTNNTKLLAKYQMVFVGAEGIKNIPEIYDALEGSPVLLVTLGYTNKQLVMINLATTENDHMRFEVNNSNIINQGLKPLPELILNGGTEIDVAKLYREGQASLVSMQKQLQAREKVLSELSAAIQNQEIVNARLVNQLAALNENIQKSDAQIASQTLQIQTQTEQIEKAKNERVTLLHDVEARTQELQTQKQQLKVIAEEIDKREKKLISLNATIKNQESEIKNQKNAIAGLDKTVDVQKVVLNYLWGSVLLGVLLLAVSLVAYSVKRRDNERLAARTKDLQIAKDRLAIAKRKAEDANQAKGDFLSLMSHELRTPLQSIIGYTEVMLEDFKVENDMRHVQDLKRVIQNGERLLKLINGVLDLAKIESGAMELDLTEIKLSNLVDEALGSVSPLFEKNGIKVNQYVDDGQTLPIADPEKIVHILINLLGNASKFSPKGTVTVKAIHESARILISVADTGIGLSVEQQQHIFDPFKQADSGITRKFQGSGLGLSITRQLCGIMGGNIQVESELGKGATFIVEIPLPVKMVPVVNEIVTREY